MAVLHHAMSKLAGPALEALRLELTLVCRFVEMVDNFRGSNATMATLWVVMAAEVIVGLRMAGSVLVEA
jgi:hypothetical protein